MDNEEQQARLLLEDTIVPLHPLARQAFIIVIADALRTARRDAITEAAAYLREAMDDVERLGAQVQTSDVRRLADELDGFKGNKHARL